MTYIGYDLPSDLEQLDKKFKSLTWTVEELSDRTDQHDRRLDDLEDDERLDTLRRDIDEVREQTESLESDLGDTRAALKNLLGQVAWLQAKLRSAHGIEPIDLDHTDDSLRALARDIRAAHAAQATLLGSAERYRCTAIINRYQRTQQQLREQLAQALAHSESLATTTIGSGQHRQAAKAFTAANQAVTTLRQELNQQQDDYADAVACLDTDDRNKAAHGPRILRGEHARTQLRARLRGIIGDAVRRRELFPTWFTTTLGWGPPAKDATTWLNTAADVLAYRLVYNITDPAAPLGPQPPYGQRQQEARLEWHIDLHSKINKIRQSP